MPTSPASSSTAEAIDPRPLLGGWWNTAPASGGPARLSITPSADGVEIAVETTAGDVMRCRPPRLFVAADAEPPAVAFTAAGPGAGGEVLLQGNLNLGLLVLGTYESGGDGVPGRFSRRFFARRERPPAPPSCGVAGGGFAGPAPEAVDLGAMLGRWRNAEPRPTAVAGIHLEQAGDDLRLRADGIDGAFASARPAVYACLDEAGQPSLCLLARCDFGRRRSELQLRVTGGVLVSAGFHAASDRRRPFFVREFYHR